MPLKTTRVMGALEADDPRQGGFCWRWRERQRRVEHARLEELGVLWHPTDVVTLAQDMLRRGMPEAHVPLSAHPWAMPEQAYALLDAGIVINGAGPYGPSPILRAACVYREGYDPHADDQDYDGGEE